VGERLARLHELRARGDQRRDDVWVVELKVRYGDGAWNLGVSIHRFRRDRIERETIYFAEPFQAPEWRAQWRAAP
jgi:hypothetical protein